MIKEISLVIPPSSVHSPLAILNDIRSALGLKKSQRIQYETLKRSIDARQKQVNYLLQLRVYIDEKEWKPQEYLFPAQHVAHKPEVHIIGAGPAGLFAALQCIELGLKPVVFERGKNVRERRRDLAALNKHGVLDEDSNYCFGEGGAGTYSDGKLYTRSKKRGELQKVLQWFHVFGAKQEILFEAHPHIGTNKLPHIIESIRTMIEDCGGEIHFGKKMTGLDYANGRVQHITLNNNEHVQTNEVILATGHSAADIYRLLHEKKIAIEAKPFALGVRIEHPQYIIDQAQYHCFVRDENLPPASYSLVNQVDGRGVFSFCMCPGGIIAPAATHHEQLVVNGWSPSKRDNPFANSGMVVSIELNDVGTKHALQGLEFQAEVERKSYQAGGGRYVAPAQRMTDFVQNRLSATLPECSYIPGVKSALLQEVLPGFVYTSLQAGFKTFGKQMKGYYTEEALVVATESRTSSPVRIPRNKETLQHTELVNLYPCAEGAGYAGGIVSAAMDGMEIVKHIARKLG